MRFIITYTDYKYERIHNLNINHIFNVNSKDKSKPLSLRKYNTFIETPHKLIMSYNIGTDIHKYIDDDCNNNYRINLISTMYNSKTIKESKSDRIINNICDTLFVNVLESDISLHKLSVQIDEDVLENYKLTNVPNYDIYIQIYDKHSIFDRSYN